MEVKAIETIYNGRRFRSRSEARWAVFFDLGKIRYEYESEGFTTGEICYLPDFYLPEYDLYVEVKPKRPGAKEELIKPLECVAKGVINRLMILSNLPEYNKNAIWWYPFAYHDYSYQSCCLGRCVIGCNSIECYIATHLYPGYIRKYYFYDARKILHMDIDFNPVNDSNLCYEPYTICEENEYGEMEEKEIIFRFSETFDSEEMAYLNGLYNSARMEQFKKRK